jgi:hypothetical protein
MAKAKQKPARKGGTAGKRAAAFVKGLKQEARLRAAAHQKNTRVGRQAATKSRQAGPGAASLRSAAPSASAPEPPPTDPGPRLAALSLAELARDARQTAIRKAAFLKSFESIGTVAGAAKAAGIGRRTHYFWMEQDAEYAKAFEDATEVSLDLLEAAARQRALLGVQEPVFYKGRIVGHVRKHSDTLLMFLLNGRRGEVFNRTKHEISGPAGGPLEVQVMEGAKAGLLKKLEQLAARVGAAPVAAAAGAEK